MGPFPITLPIRPDGEFARVVKSAPAYFNCTLPRSCFVLLTSKLAAQYRAKQKIVKLAHQTV